VTEQILDLTLTVPEAMRHQEMISLLRFLGWTRGDLARYARRDIREVVELDRGEAMIDRPLAAWLRAVVKKRRKVLDLEEADAPAADIHRAQHEYGRCVRYGMPARMAA
jgi:hypothetical protein